MTEHRCALYRILTVVVALYGVMSACVCTGHASSSVATPACHHCGPSGVDAAGVQLASHHRCCGMERAPLAVEKVSSSDPATPAGHVLLNIARLLPYADSHAAAVSPFSHAPPGDIPIYLTTQRFVI